MMRHRLVLQLYGTRIPLQERRALAHQDRRGVRAMLRYRNYLLGRHDRWWDEGQYRLHVEGLSTEDEQ